ncbi:MAG: hypothetical protein IJT54_05100 [Candidatus Methanomethylophilaceae archaeon]|nr:hypothetical protein [Candidatus Methanomethylophilaceae archaeon]
MSWQTDLKDWMPFPWSCDNMKDEGQTPNAYDDQTAFWCVFPHRIIEEECRGMDCPHCKVHHADEYVNNLMGLVQ